MGPGVARPSSAFVTLWALDNASSDNVISARVSVFLHCPVILEITIIAYFVLRKKNATRCCDIFDGTVCRHGSGRRQQVGLCVSYSTRGRLPRRPGNRDIRRNWEGAWFAEIEK